MSNKTTLSATRLIEFMGCAHRAALWLAGEPPSDPQDDTQELIRRKGLEHEAAVLSELAHSYGAAAVRIPTDAPLDKRISLTLDAINNRASIIYQGALAAAQWIGFPDFLLRTASSVGTHGYRPEDAKLARKAKCDHVVQIGVYANLLKRVVDVPIGDGVIHVSAHEPELFDLRQTEYITARLMRRFATFAENDGRKTRSRRCAACELCNYRSRCESEWRNADSPIFVAGLRTSQLLRMEVAGISTMSELASLPSGAEVTGIGPDTLVKLAAQARLQIKGTKERTHCVEVLPVEPGRGFLLLPTPQAGDVFLDLEGDPLYPEGLEYLFGLYGPLGANSESTYRAFWAHDHPGEKAAFEQVIGAIASHIARFPDAHVYHYAQYEPTALKRLAMRYATMEAELDQWLREQRFVDLFRVVRQAIRASTESYSLKDIEAIYWGGRSGAVSTASDSIVQYERWRIAQNKSILDEITRYNEEDCISTAKLRDWLEGLRPSHAAYSPLLADAQPEDVDDERAIQREQFEQARRALAQRVRSSGIADERIRDLVSELLWFHQRSQKPQWWALFERQTWTDDELVDDAESLGALSLDPNVPVETVKRSYRATYRYPPQDTKLRPGADPKIAATLEPAGSIERIEPDEGIVVLKRGVAKGAFPLKCSLLPGQPIKQQKLVDAVMAFADRFATGKLEQDRALMGFLLREPPRVQGHLPASSLLRNDEDLVQGTVRVIQSLDHGALFVQGPPGTGKTFTISHSILALLKQGRRVAVSSNSHKAINNVLSAVEERAREAKCKFRGAKKGSRNDPETAFDGDFIETVQQSQDVGSHHQLVGATAFHFAGEQSCAYDYLFVDEAGQVALGNLVAMAGCARNLILVGDQMQLPQPVQGVHPGDTGLSCLDYLLQGRATVSPQSGILLNVTYRMHPNLCQLVSEAIYDGRLRADPSTSRRYLVLSEGAHPILQSAGISFGIVEHSGCTQSSPEEAHAIRTIIDGLLREHLHNENETTRPLTLNDILIVAPFNMQVNRLKRALPEAARVGTVDKFQGQEAAVVIISMTTSHGDDAPRGTDFLFNRNRFNVAISRAQCLAIVVQSPRLQDVSIGTIADLVRLNLFARAEASAKVVGIQPLF